MHAYPGLTFSGFSGTSGFSSISGSSGTSGYSGASGFSGTSGFSGSSGGNSTTVSQSSHGFVVGDVLYHNGSIYAKARADLSSTASTVGIVQSVPTSDAFVLVTSGIINTLSGLTAGADYFLSATTAGLLTTTEPSTLTYVSKPMLIATSTTAGVVVNQRGMVISENTHFNQSGTPTATNVGDTWYETDTKIHWFWDGTYWLSQNIYNANASVEGFTVDANVMRIGSRPTSGGISAGVFNIYILDVGGFMYTVTSDGSNYWNIELAYITKAGGYNAISATNNSGSGATGLFVQRTFQVNTRYDLSAGNAQGPDIASFNLAAFKTGTPSALFAGMTLTYRLEHG